MTAKRAPAAARRRMDEVAARLAAAAPVHFIGIGGIGMAALAYQLHRRGLKVTGCDAAAGRTTEWLAGQGIPVAIGHAPEHLADGAAWCVRTAAVSADHPECRAARRRGIPVYERGLVLPVLLRGQMAIAVSGTHGKTTTTAMIAHILEQAGRDPSACVGGELDETGRMARAGAAGLIVVEADESDGTAAFYESDLAVITNIEPDHMEHFGSERGLLKCFDAFARNARRRVIYCADDLRADLVCGEMERGHSYGLPDDAAVQAARIDAQPQAVGFDVVFERIPLGRIELPAPGLHNVRNALGATAAALELDVPFATVRAALASFRPVRRRFEIVADAGGIMVISDYAHHPTEIRALVRTAVGCGRRRVLAVFQPHRYTRTLALGAEFPPAFAGVAEVVLAPVYAASEAPLPGGTAADLLAHFRTYGRVPARLADSLEAAWRDLRERLRPGDMLLVVGAGSVERIAGWAREELEGRKVMVKGEGGNLRDET